MASRSVIDLVVREDDEGVNAALVQAHFLCENAEVVSEMQCAGGTFTD
jgi:hypothetical protein